MFVMLFLWVATAVWGGFTGGLFEFLGVDAAPIGFSELCECTPPSNKDRVLRFFILEIGATGSSLAFFFIRPVFTVTKFFEVEGTNTLG